MSSNEQSVRELATRIRYDLQNLDTIEWDPPSFANPQDGAKYERLVFKGDLTDLLESSIELLPASNKAERELWNFLLEATSSHKLKMATPGRRFQVFVRDKKSQKYLGIIGMNSDYYNLAERDKHIQWSQHDRKKGNLQYSMNAYAVVPMYPFGTNFQGGKLITACLFSKELSKIFQSRYQSTKYHTMLAFTVTSLYGKSIQYDKIACKDMELDRDISATKLFELAGRDFKNISYETYLNQHPLDYKKSAKTLFKLSYLGNTHGSFISSHVPMWLYEDVKTYLKEMNETIKAPSYSLQKEKSLEKIIKLVGLRKNDIQMKCGTQRGIYQGFIYPQSQKLLSDEALTQKTISELKEMECDPDRLLDLGTVFKWWFNKHAIKRYLHLRDKNRLKRKTCIFQSKTLKPSVSDLEVVRKYMANANKKARAKGKNEVIDRLKEYHRDITSQSWFDKNNTFSSNITMDCETILAGYNLNKNDIQHLEYIVRLTNIMNQIWEQRNKDRMRKQRLRRRAGISQNLQQGSDMKPIPSIIPKKLPMPIKITPKIITKLDSKPIIEKIKPKIQSASGVMNTNEAVPPSTSQTDSEMKTVCKIDKLDKTIPCKSVEVNSPDISLERSPTLLPPESVPRTMKNTLPILPRPRTNLDAKSPNPSQIMTSSPEPNSRTKERRTIPSNMMGGRVGYSISIGGYLYYRERDVEDPCVEKRISPNKGIARNSHGFYKITCIDGKLIYWSRLVWKLFRDPLIDEQQTQIFYRNFVVDSEGFLDCALENLYTKDNSTWKNPIKFQKANFDPPFSSEHPIYGRYEINRWYIVRGFRKVKGVLQTDEFSDYQIMILVAEHIPCLIKSMKRGQSALKSIHGEVDPYVSLRNSAGRDQHYQLSHILLPSVFPTIQPKAHVDHIDDDPRNFEINNLQYLEVSTNAKKGQLKSSKSKRKGLPVIMHYPDGRSDKCVTIAEAGRLFKADSGSTSKNKTIENKIRHCLNGRMYQYLGYKFTKDEFNEILPGEIWKPYPDDTRYQISSHGRTRNSFGNFSHQDCGRNGKYSTITLTKNAVSIRKYVHELVYVTFKGPVPPGYIIRHDESAPLRDDGCYRNWLEDLKVGTSKQNNLDYYHFNRLKANNSSE